MGTGNSSSETTPDSEPRRKFPQKISLDIRIHVTVKLRIMRNRSVTYSSDATFSALADPTRRAVLDLLRKGQQPAGQIARAFPVSRPAISRHLRLLRRAHLVEERRQGRHRFYHLNPQPLKEVDFWLEQYRAFWDRSLTNLKAFVEAEYAKELEAGQSTKAGRSTKAIESSSEEELPSHGAQPDPGQPKTKRSRGNVE
jgi:DNA-binding transcriptional ArsR family regulator